MNDLNLYEQMPKSNYPIMLRDIDDSPENFSLHWHEHTEIHCIISGYADLWCSDRHYHMTEGDCLIINSNELHKGIIENCLDLRIIIEPSFFENNHVLFCNFIQDAKIVSIIKDIFKAYSERKPAYLLSVKGHTMLLTAYLMNNYISKQFTEATFSQHFRKLDKINKAIVYTDEHFSRDITTRFLCDMVHMSESHFCHIFKEVTGKTAKEYLNSVRIEKAIQLLENTDLSITEVAFCCGFSDANYFARIFKKITGKTPTAYIKKV